MEVRLERMEKVIEGLNLVLSKETKPITTGTKQSSPVDSGVSNHIKRQESKTRKTNVEGHSISVTSLIQSSEVVSDNKKSLKETEVDCCPFEVENSYCHPLKHLKDNINVRSLYNFSAFSTKAIKWIDQKLGLRSTDCSKIILHHKMIHEYLESTLRVWVEPIDTTKVISLPEKIVMLTLNDLFFSVSSFISCIFDKKAIERMIDIYFDSNKKSTYADLLIMNLLCVLGASARYHIENLKRGTRLNKSLLSNEKFLKLRELGYEEGAAYVKNSIFYFHRISVVGGAIEGIQAMLLMIVVFNDISFPDINSMVGSTAIRLAQEIGLHRKEYYEVLPSKEAERIKLLWWFCYSIDASFAMMRSIPPIISLRDVTVPRDIISQDLLEELSILHTKFCKLKSLAIPGQLFISQNNVEPFSYGRYYSVLQQVMIRAWQNLSIIIGEFYVDYFAENSFKNKTFENMIDKARLIESKIEEWKNNLPEFIKPTIHLNLNTWIDMPNTDDALIGSDISNILIIHLSFAYYYFKMLINRVVISYSDYETNQSPIEENNRHILSQKFLHGFLSAAQSILKLTSIYAAPLKIFESSIVIYPISAFISVFTHVLVHPNYPDVPGNLDIMEKFLNDFSSLKVDKQKEFEINYGPNFWNQVRCSMGDLFKLAKDRSKMNVNVNAAPVIPDLGSTNEKLQSTISVPVNNNVSNSCQPSIPITTVPMHMKQTHGCVLPVGDVNLSIPSSNMPINIMDSEHTFPNIDFSDLNSPNIDCDTFDFDTKSTFMIDKLLPGMFSIPTFLTDGIFDTPYFPFSNKEQV